MHSARANVSGAVVGSLSSRLNTDPRAMLVTEIGGARPPNEIVLD